MPLVDPCEELNRRPHITTHLAPLPASANGGLYARWPDGQVIVVIDETRTQDERVQIVRELLLLDDRANEPDLGRTG